MLPWARETDARRPRAPRLQGAEAEHRHYGSFAPKRHRSQLEIVVKTKETSSYRVDVSFQILPRQEQSIAFVSYSDKRTGQHGRTFLTKLRFADDVYTLCGSITVRDNTITIKPRSSLRAATITKQYNVPIAVAVDAVLAACRTEIG